MNSLSEICGKHDLSVDEQLSSGNNCSSVFLCSRPAGEKVVVKCGNSKREKNEILLNIRGYRKMRDDLNLGFFIPTVYDYSENEVAPYIVLEYCGPDFQSLLEAGACSVSVTEPLLETVRKVYRHSLTVGPDGEKSIHELITMINELVNAFVIPYFDLNKTTVRQFQSLQKRFRDIHQKSMFTSWDFTPNNLCKLRDIKFIDPLSEKVTGNPIPGLACYAGILRDVHHFRNAVAAYDMMYRFATVELSKLLHMDQESAERFFLLGRLFQSLMGIRFRVTKSRSDAEPFLVAAKDYLTQVV